MVSAPATVMTSRTPICESSKFCYLCGCEGQRVYHDLSDRLWSVPGSWNFYKCPDRACGVMWLDPRPIAEYIPLLYEDYFTHGAPRSPRQQREERLRIKILENGFGFSGVTHEKKLDLVGWLLSKIGFIRDYAAGSIMWLTPELKGSLLDLGCGGCELLMRMRNFGWEVAGVEPDPKALARAREKLGVDVRASLSEFPESQFDLVSLSHVIEHVVDPIATLRDSARLLRSEGRLIVATPNIESLGHKFFGAKWVALEPPRHLILFSPHNLRVCAERAGLLVEDLRTSARSAHFVWTTSQLIRKRGGMHGKSPRAEAKFHTKLASIAFQVIEHQLLGKHFGEEIVLVARKV
jgi:2-polyprenyl-3-methyl-5-hydroxy-6-metoxy-1,4-benzoquinol methylase